MILIINLRRLNKDHFWPIKGESRKAVNCSDLFCGIVFTTKLIIIDENFNF
ncbi:MAG: hypothetical protein FD155_709 [Bacteroidetes bacterium]|nr:MAG: hypothetical protein FD155_709 [Bacteroidota bacterium]